MSKREEMREKMPDTAELVDWLREQFGREVVDGAIRAGMRAARQHAEIASQYGPAQADAWLRAHRMPAGCFWASEGGHEIGVRRA